MSNDNGEGAPTFRNELSGLINRHSMENGSDTPDFILAEFLNSCLQAFDEGVRHRERWSGRGPKPVSLEDVPQQ